MAALALQNDGSEIRSSQALRSKSPVAPHWKSRMTLLIRFLAFAVVTFARSASSSGGKDSSSTGCFTPAASSRWLVALPIPLTDSSLMPKALGCSGGAAGTRPVPGTVTLTVVGE
jgi:hypothetical protein